MKAFSPHRVLLLAGLLAILPASGPAAAGFLVQCPGDVDNDGVPDQYFKTFGGVRTGWVTNAAGSAACSPLDTTGTPCVRVTNATPGRTVNAAWRSNVRCMHITCGDGYQSMGDGHAIYTFGFRDITGTPSANAEIFSFIAAEWPAPTIVLDEGTEFYLTLSNVNTAVRPDLFDPHTVHFHGFPNASSVFDGMPEGSISINGGNSLTYYYKIVIPGTYMYHCHVEAAEHMQMGMLGNLFVRPAQNRLASQTFPNGFSHVQGSLYAYNDGDGSTFCNKEVPIQVGSFDEHFHTLHQQIQELPFSTMHPSYAQLNGRGYPDTVNPAPLAATFPQDNAGDPFPVPADFVLKTSQNVSSAITIPAGQKLLLRISSLDVTHFWTVTGLGLPMKVVGVDGRLLRSSPTGGGPGVNLAYETSSITIGGGQATDVLVDTAGVAPGTYFLYTTNLNYLANDKEDFGGMMTEIVVQ